MLSYEAIALKKMKSTLILMLIQSVFVCLVCQDMFSDLMHEILIDSLLVYYAE